MMVRQRGFRATSNAALGLDVVMMVVVMMVLLLLLALLILPGRRSGGPVGVHIIAGKGVLILLGFRLRIGLLLLLLEASLGGRARGFVALFVDVDQAAIEDVYLRFPGVVALVPALPLDAVLHDALEN